MPLILSDYQRDNIKKVIASWASNKKISDYQSYLRTLDKWMSLITDGRPIVSIQESVAGELSEISELVDFLTAVYTDIMSQEAVLNDIQMNLMQTKQSVLSTVKMWQRRADNIKLLINKVAEENKTKANLVTIETFTNDATGVYENTEVNRRTGELEVKARRITPVEVQPERITVSLYPETCNGLWHTFDNTSVKDTDIMAYAEIQPTVLYNGVQYNGIVSQIDMKYFSSITFNRIEILPKAYLKLELIDVRVKYLYDLEWISIYDSTDIITNKIEQIIFKDANVNVVTDIRLVFLQKNAFRDNIEQTESSYYHQLSQLENTTITAKKKYDLVFDCSLYSISFSTYSYAIPSTGRYLSHVQDDGYYIGNKPIGNVKLKTNGTLSAISSIEYTLEDSLTDRKIPLLPEGTTVYREPVRYSDVQNEIKLKFPMTAGSTLVFYMNGKVIPVNYIIRNSRRIYLKEWYPAQIDRVLVQYTPAVDHSVVVYMIAPPGLTIADLNQNTNTTVFPNWNSAFLYAKLFSNVQVVPVLARLDEYDYWFFGGTQDSNVGRNLITVPPL